MNSNRNEHRAPRLLDSLVWLALSLSSPALAAGKPEPPATDDESDQTAVITLDDRAPAREPQTARARVVIDEIVVTAQKEKQSIQDVPLSVSALSGEDLREAGVQDLHAVSRITPNVQVNQEQTRAFIRGLGSAANQTIEHSVAIVIDGVYYGRPGYLKDGFLDLDRLEVLRGPQNTMFGKNAVAGVLGFVTANPEREFLGRIKAQGAGLDQEYYEAMVTGPILPDILDARLAAAKRRAPGRVYNNYTGRDVTGVDTENLRGKLAFHAGSRANAVISVESTRQAQLSPAPQIFLATDNLRAVHEPFDPDMEYELNHRTSLNAPVGGARKGLNSYLSVDIDAARHTITALTGYSDSRDEIHFDGDDGPGPYAILDAGENYRQFSQEVRFASEPGALDYIVGLYYFRGLLDAWNTLFIFHADENSADFANFPDSITFTGLPGQEGAPLVVDTFSPERTDGFNDQRIETGAIFGQLRWHPWDPVELTLAARYTRETKTMRARRTLSETSVLVPALGGEEFDILDRTEEGDLSPKFSLSYQPTDNLNVYLTLARGFKAGGYSSAALKPEDLKFRSERANTLEVGVKGRFWGGAGQFNLGLFQMEFKDLQVSASNGTTFIISNAASAVSRGVELDAMVLPFRGMTLAGAVGFLHARYRSYPNAPCPAGTPESEQDGAEDGTCDLSGRPLSQAPRWNLAFQAEYVPSLDRLGLPVEAFMGWAANFQSKMYVDLDLDPLDIRRAVWIHDARIGLRSNSRRWQLSLSMRNVFDEIYKVQSTDVPLYAGSHWATINPPRQLTATLDLEF